MDNNNDPNRGFGAFARLALGAGVAAGVGYAAFKLFSENKNDQPVEVSYGATGSTNRFVPNRKVIVVRKMGECKPAINMLKAHYSECNVLAIDCEWESDHSRHPVALLQLATHRGLCVIFHLSEFVDYNNRLFPSELRDLLRNKQIFKVGVSPQIDAKHMQTDYSVHVASTIDLRFLAKLAGCQPGSLAKMSENYLGEILDKDGARTSNWETSQLSEEQINYAADDGFASIELFKYFAELIAGERRFDNETDQLKYVIRNHCAELLDKYYNHAPNSTASFVRFQ